MLTQGHCQQGLAYAVRLVRSVCRTAGDPSLIADVHYALREAGVTRAVQQHNTGAIFDWLVEWLSYQGVSDAAAASYLAGHGTITARSVQSALARQPECRKLQTYWSFEGCGYRKAAATCSQKPLYASCPLPRHDLRNGKLNQAAYSLYLFFRDVAAGDFVSWADRQVAEADRPAARDRGARLAASVIEPMTNIFGVSHKVLTMTLSWLLSAGDPARERWQAAGASMIAIDTLVHNWMHRTGILRSLDAAHPYGPACYGPAGCSDIVARVARRIDATAFNADFPRYFPRFVQHAIWRFCAQSGLNECNGNRVDDRRRCRRVDCELYRCCGRIALDPMPNMHRQITAALS